MRADVVKVIYVSQPKSVFNMTIFPGGVSGSVNDAFAVKSYSISVSSASTLGFNGNELALTEVPTGIVSI